MRIITQLHNYCYYTFVTTVRLQDAPEDVIAKQSSGIQSRNVWHLGVIYTPNVIKKGGNLHSDLHVAVFFSDYNFLKCSRKHRKLLSIKTIVVSDVWC